MNDKFGERRKHPAYGLMQINKVTGRGRFFGSHIESQNFFTLTISQASARDGQFGDTHYSAEEQIIQVNISPAQFVELITSMNHGVGIPCTINRLGVTSVEELPEDEATGEQKAIGMFQDKIKTYFDVSLKKSIDKAELLLNKKRVTKGDLKDIVEELYFLRQNMKDNFPWYMEQIQEASDKIVTSAKIEVESFVTTIIQKAGLEAIAEGRFPKLLSRNKEEKK